MAVLEDRIQQELKKAMVAKNQAALRALRAVKSAILLEKTSGNQQAPLNDDTIIKLLQKLVKQREESIAIYQKEKREDLAADEIAEVVVLKEYLPTPLSDEALQELVDQAIEESGAKTKAEMGKVMPLAIAKAKGKADGKRISAAVAKRLQ